MKTLDLTRTFYIHRVQVVNDAVIVYTGFLPYLFMMTCGDRVKLINLISVVWTRAIFFFHFTCQIFLNSSLDPAQHFAESFVCKQLKD